MLLDRAGMAAATEKRLTRRAIAVAKRAVAAQRLRNPAPPASAV